MVPILEAFRSGATMGEIGGMMRMAYGYPYDPHGLIESLGIRPDSKGSRDHWKRPSLAAVSISSCSLLSHGQPFLHEATARTPQNWPLKTSLATTSPPQRGQRSFVL